ncbi:hypothetical protein ACFX2I_030809 [Malus domestica]
MGGSLGLLVENLPGYMPSSSQYPFVAVEFDIFTNKEESIDDPEWEHSQKRGENIDERPMANMDLIDNDFGKQIGLRKFSYNELTRATSNFVEREKLGDGGFGGVYKGFIKDLNSYVANKRISKGSRQGLKEYASELAVISQLRHWNLVQLIG